jgi:hypothetical protein
MSWAPPSLDLMQLGAFLTTLGLELIQLGEIFITLIRTFLLE